MFDFENSKVQFRHSAAYGRVIKSSPQGALLFHRRPWNADIRKLIKLNSSKNHGLIRSGTY